jgi:flagellar basal body-associated protein FliL
MELVIIIVIIVVVLAAGIFLARNVFVRGTMPSTPQEDREDPGDTVPTEARTQRRRAPE